MRGTSATPASSDLHPDKLELLQSVLNTAGLAIIVLDPAGFIRLFNSTCETLTGYSSAEMLGREIFDTLLPADQRDNVCAVIDKLVAGDYPSEYENDWLTRSGERRCIHWHNTVLMDDAGQVEYVVGTGTDVTDWRQTEKELRQSAQQMRLLIDYSPALIGQLDPQLNFIFANESYQKWFGLSLDEIAGRHIREIIGEAAYLILGPRLKKALSGEVVAFDSEVPFQHGGTRFIHATYVPHFTEDGTIDGLFVMTIDLSEQYRLASALSATNRRNQAVLDTAVDGIITISKKGIVESFNRSAERIFGYRASEVIGKNVNMLMPSPYAEHHDEYLQHYINTGERRIIGIGREVLARKKDGTVFPIELAVGEFTENGQPFFTGFTRDITDRKRMEQDSRERLDQLAHVARQNSLGSMTSGLAHEINQPLTAIVTTAQACLRLLQSERASTQVLQKSLTQIAGQGERASKIIYEMRQFLRQSTSQNRTFQDINVLIPGVLELVAHEISAHSIHVVTRLNEELPPIPINHVQIEQTLLNLVRNAIEAMSDAENDRFLEIETGYSETDGRFVAVTIADNGPGLPSEVLEHLFEPFITTKEHGLGQGLSISRSIARAHNGDLDLISNENGKGTRFSITLPVEMDAD